MSESHLFDPDDVCTNFLHQEELKKVGWSSKILYPDTKLILKNCPNDLKEILRLNEYPIIDDHSDTFDLLEIVDFKYRVFKKHRIVYFDNQKYDSSGGFKGEGFKKLKVSLKNFIKDNAGFEIYFNGSDLSKKEYNTRIVRCGCSGRKYRGNVEGAQCVTKTYRKHTLHHDRTNGRGKEGLTMIRAGKTKRPTEIKEVCKFNFIIGHDHSDSNGFFVLTSFGHNKHQYHTKLPLAKSFHRSSCLNIDDYLLSQTVERADASVAVNRNILFEKTGKMMKESCIRWVNQWNNYDNKSSTSTQDATDIDKMIEMLNDKNCLYLALLHEVDRNNNQDFITTVNGDGTKISHGINDFEEDEYDIMLSYGASRRKVKKVSIESSMLLGIAWITSQEKNLFDMYPNVIFVDITHDTNIEGRPFFP